MTKYYILKQNSFSLMKAYFQDLNLNDNEKTKIFDSLNPDEPFLLIEKTINLSDSAEKYTNLKTIRDRSIKSIEKLTNSNKTYDYCYDDNSVTIHYKGKIYTWDEYIKKGMFTT